MLLMETGAIILVWRDMMDVLDKINKRIDTFRDEMIDLQIRLCAVPAISPTSGGEGEAKKAELLLDLLKSMGFDQIDLIKVPDLNAPSGYRPNILALYKGKSSAKTIWIMTHMDVVPPGELSQWEGNPFRAWVTGGKIFGRGVEDNQQDMIASLYAIKAFHAEGIKPQYDIGIVLVSDEETGNKKGIEHILKHSNPFRKQDLIIVPDAGNADGTMIEVAEKSILWLKIKTIGQQAHGSTPEKGVNSFKAASYFITQLSQLYQVYGDKDPLFDPPASTFEPTKKETNVPNINTIPGEDIFFMDSRILPKYRIEDVKNSIREIADTIENRFKVKIHMEDIQNAPATPPTSADAPVVKALQQAIKSTYGITGMPTGIGGGTVAAFFRAAQYDAACWSKMEETGHQPNECCVIENMMGDTKVFAHIFLQK